MVFPHILGKAAVWVSLGRTPEPYNLPQILDCSVVGYHVMMLILSLMKIS